MNAKIAQRIKEKRLKAGISQESLSHLADLDRKYVGIIEKGQTNISIKVLSQLCDALDVSLSDFFKDL
jgi:transcriptional regulator with XRE-family HTH domain